MKDDSRRVEVSYVEDEDVILEGRPLNSERVDAIVADVRAQLQLKREANLQPGGKSMTAPGVHSPVVQFRIPADLRSQAEEIARADGVSLSKFGRDAFVEAIRKRAAG